MRSRSLILAVGGIAVVAIVAAIAYWFLVVQPRGAPPASVVTATVAPTPAVSPPAEAKPTVQPSPAKPTVAAAPASVAAPAFDVVRVEPSGDAVVAGRASPGARVALSDDGKAIGDVVANDAGQFVILPPTFSPGRHPLQLSAKVGDGAPQLSDVVVVEVAGATAAAVAAAPAATPSAAAAKPSPVASTPGPEPSVAVAATSTPAAAAGATPTAAAPAPAAALTPTPAAPAAAPSPAPSATILVAVASVRPIDPAGLEAIGSAPPGAHVRLRLNNAVLAEVVAGSDGQWRLTIERGVTPGDYDLEAAVVDAGGNVLARAESPFAYPQRESVASAAAPAAAPPSAAPSAAPPPPLPVAGEPSPDASTPVAAAMPSPPLASPASTAVATSAAPEPTPSAAPAAATSATAAPAPLAPAAPAQTTAAEEPQAATPSHAVVQEVRTYTVVKGDNLWDLAVKYYGDGLRYADIFSANSAQIHNPNLIFIGQIFVVPTNPTTTPPAAR